MEKLYRVYIDSDEHPRTINTPKCARTNYTCFEVFGMDALKRKVAELRERGEHVNDIRTELGTRIWM